VTRFLETRVVPADLRTTRALVLDWTRDPEWRTAVTSMTGEPLGPAVRGQRLLETMMFAGATFTTPTEIVDVTDTSAAFAGGSAMVRVHGRRTLEAVPDGTRVTAEVDVRFARWATPLTGLLAPAYRRRHRQDLDRLAALLARRTVS
jgi:hypothetical protein